jgi:hypothetical protein
MNTALLFTSPDKKIIALVHPIAIHIGLDIDKTDKTGIKINMRILSSVFWLQLFHWFTELADFTMSYLKVYIR